MSRLIAAVIVVVFAGLTVHAQPAPSIVADVRGEQTMSCSVNCVEMAELADDYLHDRMYWIERVRYRVHLATCPVCRAQLERDDAVGRTIEGPDGVSPRSPS